mgnify:CR=1 FL=1
MCKYPTSWGHIVVFPLTFVVFTKPIHFADMITHLIFFILGTNNVELIFVKEFLFHAIDLNHTLAMNIVFSKSIGLIVASMLEIAT